MIIFLPETCIPLTASLSSLNVQQLILAPITQFLKCYHYLFSWQIPKDIFLSSLNTFSRSLGDVLHISIQITLKTYRFNRTVLFFVKMWFSHVRTMHQLPVQTRHTLFKVSFFLLLFLFLLLCQVNFQRLSRVIANGL